MNPGAPSIGMILGVFGSYKLPTSRAQLETRLTRILVSDGHVHGVLITPVLSTRLLQDYQNQNQNAFKIEISAMEGLLDDLFGSRVGLPNAYSILQTSCPYFFQLFYLLPFPPS
jgi:hypothetical protein